MLPTERNAVMIGFVIEGTPKYKILTGVTLDNYRELYAFGKDLWNNSDCSKFAIGVVADWDDGREHWLVGHVRPDKWNFGNPDAGAFIVTYWEEENESTSHYQQRCGTVTLDSVLSKIFADTYGKSFAEIC